MTCGSITHLVLFRYRTNLSWGDLEKHFSAFRALEKQCLHPDTGKPYMLSMRMGKNRSWETYSKGMTHAFVLEFSSQTDLDYFLSRDPIQLDFARRTRSLVEDSTVIDIKDGELFGEKPVMPGTVGTKIYPGRCHCGRLEWEVRMSDRPEHVLCHCDTCKKLGGGPYSCNAIVSQGDIAMIRGEPGSYTYAGACGKPIHTYFCRTCTSHVYQRQEGMSDKIIVRTLLLDGGAEMGAPGSEIFSEGRLRWVKELQQNLEHKIHGGKPGDHSASSTASSGSTLHHTMYPPQQPPVPQQPQYEHHGHGHGHGHGVHKPHHSEDDLGHQLWGVAKDHLQGSFGSKLWHPTGAN